MLKVGITGNIGSGKTTISKIFEVLGTPVFYADDAAKTAMATDERLIEEIKSTFGQQSYFDDGTLNRKHLATIVFNNDEQLKKLNGLVHPAVFRAFDKWSENHKNARYLLKEAALLFESGSYKLCDCTIMVKAPFETRVERVIKRDNLSRTEIERREANQFPEEKKIALADYVINNDGTKLVIPQVLALHAKFGSLVISH